MKFSIVSTACSQVFILSLDNILHEPELYLGLNPVICFVLESREKNISWQHLG